MDLDERKSGGFRWLVKVFNLWLSRSGCLKNVL